MKTKKKKLILDEKEMRLALHRMAHEIVEKANAPEGLALVGIQTRGVYLAKRLKALIEKIEGRDIPFGILDITLYRDDVNSISKQPMVKETELPFDITGKTIVLVDDVLFTGRTVRAAIDELMDFGRPRMIKLAVFMDRGGRELPIQPDVVGKYYPTLKGQTISVELKEIDAKDSVFLCGE